MAATERTREQAPLSSSRVSDGAIGLAASITATDIVHLIVRGTLERIQPLTTLSDEPDILIREAMLGAVCALVESHVVSQFVSRTAFPVRELVYAVIRAVKDLAAFHESVANSPALSPPEPITADSTSQFPSANSLMPVQDIADIGI